MDIWAQICFQKHHAFDTASATPSQSREGSREGPTAEAGDGLEYMGELDEGDQQEFDQLLCNAGCGDSVAASGGVGHGQDTKRRFMPKQNGLSRKGSEVDDPAKIYKI